MFHYDRKHQFVLKNSINVTDYEGDLTGQRKIMSLPHPFAVHPQLYTLISRYCIAFISNPNLKSGHHFLLNVLVDFVSRLTPGRWHDFRNLSMNQHKWRKTISSQMPSVLIRWVNTKYLKGRIYMVGKEAQWVKMLNAIVRGIQFDAPESHKSQNFTIW